MSSESILKKSLFGGFKKSDVLDYIEKLQGENLELKKQLEEAAKQGTQIEDLKEECEELKAKFASAESDCAAATEINEKQAARIKELDAALEAKNSEISDLESAKKDADNKVVALTEQINHATEEKSNTIIENAAKYADSIVENAKLSARKILTDAGSTIASASENIAEASGRVKTAQNNLDFSLTSVKDSVDSLISGLTKLSADLTEGE